MGCRLNIRDSSLDAVSQPAQVESSPPILTDRGGHWSHNTGPAVGCEALGEGRLEAWCLGRNGHDKFSVFFGGESRGSEVQGDGVAKDGSELQSSLSGQ